MNLSLFIARRISLKQDNGRRRSPAVTIAVSGIALSIVIMFLTLAIVPGFKHQIRDKLTGFDAQITLSAPPESQYGIEITPLTQLTDSLARAIHYTAPDAEISLTAKQPAVIKTDNDFAGVVFHGYDADHDWKFVSDNIVEGQLPDYSVSESDNSIIISRMTADRLSLSVGDKVNGYFFTDNNMRTRRFIIAAIYDSHFGDYDRLTAFMSLAPLQKIIGATDDQGTSIELRNIDPSLILSTKHLLERETAALYYAGDSPTYLVANDIFDTGVMYFNWLDLLDTNVIVILVLMGCVAGITLISCLFIIILERISMIGTLKALGAGNPLIRRMFIWLAERIVLRGIIIGNIIGLGLVWIQWQFHLIPLDPEAYYLSYVPVEFNIAGILLMNIFAVVVSLLIMIIPTHIIANISPAKVMRYE